MRRLIRATLLPGLLPAFLLAVAAAAQVAAAPLQVDQVAPGVYVHIGKHKDFEDGYDGDICNIGFVIGADAVAVVDTGGSYAVGKALKEAIRAITRLPIRYVVNTHGHPDHVFGNAAFLEADPRHPGAPPQVLGHFRLPRAITARGETYVRNLRKQLGAAAGKSTLIAPDRTVLDRLTLDLGHRKLELRAWPRAHTDNDLTLFDVASGTLWTGDLLFIERTPSIDGDVQGWLAVMHALEKVRARTTIPGHGPVTRNKNEALARQHAYLATLLHDVRSAIGNRRGMTETMETAAASERGRWQLFDVVNRRNVNLLYPVLEWE
jgi:quinoprotein relay system zinc metallohydrolase 2